MTNLDYYKYALLSTASYVRAGELDPADPKYAEKFARLAKRTKGVRLGILHKSAGPARWRNFPSFSNVVPELRSHDSV